MRKKNGSSLVPLKNELIQHKIDYVLILLFLIISALIRFTPIFRGDIPFLFDHGRDMLEVKNIVVDHKLTLLGPFTGLQGVFQGPLHFYLLSIPFILSGGHPASGTFAMAIIGLLGIIFSYVLGRKMIDNMFGIILALLFAVSPLSIAFSAHFWNPHWIPFCMILFYFFLHQSIFDNDLYWLPTSFMAGIIAQFELPFGVILMLIIILAAVFLKRGALKSRYFWLSFLLFGSTFLSQVFFDIRHQFLMTKSILNFLHGSNQGLGGAIPFNKRFMYRIDEIQHATIFAVSYNAVLAYLFFTISALYFVMQCVKKNAKVIKTSVIFLLAPFVFFLIYLSYGHNAWSWYWIGLQTSYYFFLAYLLSRITFHKNTSLLVIAVLIIWLVATFPMYNIFGRSGPGEAGTLKNELNAIDFIYHDAHGQQFGAFVYTPPIYDYTYQYLFWWVAKDKYHYQPTKDKKGIFYLIMESDFERPYAPKGWKETVIKTGNVLWDKTLPGGITIEKRKG